MHTSLVSSLQLRLKCMPPLRRNVCAKITAPEITQLSPGLRCDRLFSLKPFIDLPTPCINLRIIPPRHRPAKQVILGLFFHRDRTRNRFQGQILTSPWKRFQVKNLARCHKFKSWVRMKSTKGLLNSFPFSFWMKRRFCFISPRAKTENFRIIPIHGKRSYTARTMLGHIFNVVR